VQRITGALLAVFLFTHVKVLHWDFDFSQGFIDFGYVIGRLGYNLAWLIFYFLFIISAMFHGLNGLWAVVLDFRPSRKTQLAWLTVLWAAGILTAYYAIQTLSSFYTGGQS